VLKVEEISIILGRIIGVLSNPGKYFRFFLRNTKSRD
jgi:hypothetical protein